MNRRALLLAAFVAIILGLAACSGDDGAGSASASSTTTSTAPADTTSTTPVTEPPGTDTAAVQPIVQSLIERYDTAVAAILADPRVASDSEHAAVVSYLQLFTPGSSFTEGALAFWTREGESGRFYRAGPRGRLTQSTVMAVTSSSADEVTFTICALNSIEITDASGTVIESQGAQTAASVVALRVDGTWLLRDLTQASTTGCPEPGPSA